MSVTLRSLRSACSSRGTYLNRIIVSLPRNVAFSCCRRRGGEGRRPVEALAEFERELIRSRVRSDLAAARSRGRRLGRPPSVNVQRIAEIRRLHATGCSGREIGRRLGISEGSVRRLRKISAAA